MTNIACLHCARSLTQHTRDDYAVPYNTWTYTRTVPYSTAQERLRSTLAARAHPSSPRVRLNFPCDIDVFTR
eukprot:7517738-Pyramimonas_sp.AAC.1